MRRCVIALFLLACESAPVDPCVARIDRIEARLTNAVSHAAPPGAPTEIELVRGRHGAPIAATTPILVIGPDEVELAGRGVGGGDDLDRIAATLHDDLAMLGAASGVDTLLVALWIAPEVQVERAVRILSQAPPEVSFALLIRSSDARAAPAWVRRTLGRDPYRRRARLSRLWERVTASCEPARDALPLAEPDGTIGTPPIAPLIAAMRECGCDGVNLAAIEGVATAAILGPDGAISRMPQTLRFGPATEEGRELAMPAEATIDALALRLASDRGEGTIWIGAQ